MIGFLITLLNVTYYVFLVALIVRMILSFIGPYKYDQIWRIVRDITEPILAPIRRLLPPMGGIDLSPMLALLALGFIVNLLGQFLHSLQ